MPTPATVKANKVHLYIGAVKGGSMTSGSAALTSFIGFTAADVGMPIWVLGAGASDTILFSTVASVTDSGHATLADNAGQDTPDGLDNNVILYREIDALVGTIRYTSDLAMRDVLEFTYDTAVGDPLPQTGAPVLMSIDTLGEQFGGSIEKPKSGRIPGTQIVRNEISCNSWDALLSKRTTGLRSYDNQKAGDIIKDLLANTMGGDYLSNAGVEDGPTLVHMAFDYEMNLAAYQRIARESSNDVDDYYVYVSPRRVVHFGKRETTAAPWTIDDRDGSDGNVRPQVTKTGTREKLANRVFVKASQAVLAETTESYPGDGSSREFAVLSPVGQAPTVSVNSTTKTVGILNVDTGKDFYWEQGSNVITQDAGGTLLTSGDTIEITYQPLGDALVLYSNATAVTARAAIEGGPGYYEYVVTISTPTTIGEMNELAEALAKRMGNEITDLDIESRRGGLAAGQLLTVHLDEIDVDGDFLIEQVVMSCDQQNYALWSLSASG